MEFQSHVVYRIMKCHMLGRRGQFQFAALYRDNDWMNRLLTELSLFAQNLVRGVVVESSNDSRNLLASYGIHISVQPSMNGADQYNDHCKGVDKSDDWPVSLEALEHSAPFQIAWSELMSVIIEFDDTCLLERVLNISTIIRLYTVSWWTRERNGAIPLVKYHNSPLASLVVHIWSPSPIDPEYRQLVGLAIEFDNALLFGLLRPTLTEIISPRRCYGTLMNALVEGRKRHILQYIGKSLSLLEYSIGERQAISDELNHAVLLNFVEGNDGSIFEDIVQCLPDPSWLTREEGKGYGTYLSQYLATLTLNAVEYLAQTRPEELYLVDSRGQSIASIIEAEASRYFAQEKIQQLSQHVCAARRRGLSPRTSHYF